MDQQDDNVWKSEMRYDLILMSGMLALIALLLYGGANWGWFDSSHWYNSIVTSVLFRQNV